MDDFTRKTMEKYGKNTVKQVEKIIDKNPEFKQIRSIKDGEKYSQINSGVNDPQYKENYDKINWSKNKAKPKFKIKINGKVVSDPNEEE
jgi:hypothetical protein